jgi:inositol-phosphate transport system ATP-binding protein
MRDGRIEQIGSSDDLYLRPNSLFVASFIGSPPINLIEGQIEDGCLGLGESALSASNAPNGEVTAGIRPEHLTIGGEGLPGRIAQIEPMGREVLFVVETEIGQVRVLEPGSIAAHRSGDQVNVSFAEGDTLVFDRAKGERITDARFHL